MSKLKWRNGVNISAGLSHPVTIPFSAHLQVIRGSLVILLELYFDIFGLDELHTGLVIHLLQRGEILKKLLAVLLVLVGDQFLLVKLDG